MSYFEIWHAFKEGPNVCWDVPKNTFFYFNQLKRRVFWEHLNKLRPSYIFRAFLSSKISLNPHATVPCPPNKVKSLLFILFQGHEGPVWQLAWAHPRYGTILASCSYDRKVILWREDRGSWSQLYNHTCHDSSVNSVRNNTYTYITVFFFGQS